MYSVKYITYVSLHLLLGSTYLQMLLLPSLFIFNINAALYCISHLPSTLRFSNSGHRGSTVSLDGSFAARPACTCYILIPAPWPQPPPAAASHHCINYSRMIQKQSWAECLVSDKSQSQILMWWSTFNLQ